MKSLAEHLGVLPPRDEPDTAHPVVKHADPVVAAEAEGPSLSSIDYLANVTDSVEFCQGIVRSREFRQYLLSGILLGELPSVIMGRILDHAWGKPVERIEHTGRDGKPIETVTEIRRVIVHAAAPTFQDDEPTTKLSQVTH